MYSFDNVVKLALVVRCVEYVLSPEIINGAPVLYLVQPHPVSTVLLTKVYNALHLMVVVFLHDEVQYESKIVFLFQL